MSTSKHCNLRRQKIVISRLKVGNSILGLFAWISVISMTISLHPVNLSRQVSKFNNDTRISQNSISTTISKADNETRAKVAQKINQSPLSFEKNLGQTDESVKFISRGLGYTMLVKPDAAVIHLNSQAGAS